MNALAVKTLLAVWAGLLALLALTAASAYINLGLGNLFANLAIAAAKVGLIALFFMHLRHSDGTVRLVAGAALFFLFILAFLSFGDFLTRPLTAAPWHAPVH
jgi:cytochrome c oxidase subunit 4